MSSTRSHHGSTSQPSPKGGRARWKPYQLQSSNHGEGMSQTVVNNYISGGHGGGGGHGGVHGGGGGSGEGPTLHYEITGENITMNMKQKIYVLYGLGGAGKTQIALKFIEESTCFNDRLFLDASTTDTIQTGLKNIMTAEKTGNASQDALTWLIGKHENWLLFLDNADDPGINLNQFLPRCKHGNIIITSRNPNLRVYGQSSLVTDMEEPDVVALLLKSSQQEISASNELLAQNIVKLCSFIHWDNISEDIFSRAANPVMQLSETATSRKFLSHFVGATGKWDSLSFLKVTNEIKAYSLLNLNPERKTFSIHPLVHSWARTTLDQAESYHQCMDEVLGNSIWEIPEHDMPLASLRLVSHVDSLSQHLPINYGWQYAHIYHYAGRYAEATELGIIEVEKQRKLHGEDGLNTLCAIDNLAGTYHRHGQFEEAEKLQVEVLEKLRRLLGGLNHRVHIHYRPIFSPRIPFRAF
ncbi:hypothetical protein C8R45DRAFT_1081506 [Mycena sanguinolenta]|nr:hypothetical protein C8R45DRAFT_1081506 [Mycena sanguinolenta]